MLRHRWYLLLVIILSGCDAIRTTAEDDRSVTHDCDLTLPGGTHMQCGSAWEKDTGEKDEGASIVLPVPAAEQ
jgi:hypothetical protein